MSMISGQIDKLRNAAEFYDGSQAANLMRDAADTIWQLRDDLQRANAENAKLRELVQKMMRFFEDGDWCTACECAKECEAQEQYEEDCLMRGVFHDHMRELGVEE